MSGNTAAAGGADPLDEHAELKARLAGADLPQVGAELAQALAPGAPSSDAFDALSASLAEEDGLRARLQSLPTWLRRLLGIALVITVVAAVALAGPRPDLEEFPRWLLGVGLAGMGLVALIGVWAALRPIHRPPPSPWIVAVLAAAGVALPFGLALLPGRPPTMAGVTVPPAPACFAFGSALALPIGVGLLLLLRIPRPNVACALLIAAAAGLTGNLTLHVHCPANELAHLLAGHASIGVAFLVVAALVAKMMAMDLKAWMARYKEVMAEYGLIAFGIYITVWLSTWAVFALLIRFGLKEVEPGETGTGTLFGLLVVAWVPTKFTQPFRIAATVVLTPPIAAWLRHGRSAKSESDEEAASPEAD